MDQQIFVYVDLDNTPHLVGRLWLHVRNRVESATFRYDEEWLRNPVRFALEPALQMDTASHHTTEGKSLFGAIGDSAPDRWGRALMMRAEARRARLTKEPAQTLWEVDYLLRVDDETRQGALRFAEREGGPFLREAVDHRTPPLIELPALLAASEHVTDEVESDQELRLLLAPGSSLGGARPKASVRDKNGQLAIAKFPHHNDRIQTVLWEAVAFRLAAAAGIQTATARIEKAAGRPVLLLHRFDRHGSARRPFLSAMSMLSAADHETHSYLEIADALQRYGAAPTEDLHELWRRIVFSILISNTDDHLWNHGFLYEGSQGWRLSPAYDMNPVPVQFKPRILSTLIDEQSSEASIDIAMSVAEYFRLSPPEARWIIRKVAQAASRWKQEAVALKISKAEIEIVASAFEHEELAKAMRGNL
ncbi:MAG: type II toxin-antitoxin system HipA family toxin [Acidobacteriaceae bacterium]|nr:type II toxin-antitoxin system HipA family toxin [Acidobacteriaceae bacterium]